MTDCDGCHWHEYEKETGHEFCRFPDVDDERFGQQPCLFRYSEADARADAKYGREDHY